MEYNPLLLISSLALILVSTLLLSLWFGRFFANTKSRYPPGPPSDAFLGHVRIMPREYAWETFTEWSKKFGDIIYVHFWGRSIVILNSVVAARELLDKRSGIYSDRPRLVLFQEIMNLNCIVPFQRYRDIRFKRHRKLLQKHFSATGVISFRPAQRSETHLLLLRLIQTPESYAHHIERLVAASIMMVTYGHRIKSDDDPFLRLVYLAGSLIVEHGSPGGTTIDFFPILRYLPAWLPGNKFKRHGIRGRKAVSEILEVPFDMAKNERANGVLQPSFINSLLEDHERGNDINVDHEEDIKNVCGVSFVAAVETSTTVLMTFMLAMVLNPLVAKRAQKEIDDVIGFDRLPDFEDRDSLPYIDCIVKETIRWNPPAPLGLPHSTIEADIYEGMHIPKTSMVIANMWAMLRDEAVYSEPDKFYPERFLEKATLSDGKYQFQSLGDYDPINIVYGFGRRICPGRFYADAGIWLAVANILASFDILPPLNSDGETDMPKAEFADGLSRQPKDFKCRIVPRTEGKSMLVKKCAEAAEAGLL